MIGYYHIIAEILFIYLISKLIIYQC